MKIGALETGGTKIVMSIYGEAGQVQARESIPTETPALAMPKLVAFLRGVDALGIGSFGPLELDPSSPAYGSITATPKLAWRNYPLLPKLCEALDLPRECCAIDTDVNAAALAEARLGAAQGLDSVVYVTVGTGIGAGIYAEGKLVHGLMHPEVGHILLRPMPDDPLPHGVCPYHDGCLEGLAAGPALGKRAGCDARTLADDHPAFTMEAHYLAQMCAQLTLTLSPKRIILGGGVMARKALYPMIHREMLRLLNGYLPKLEEQGEGYIVPPALYPDSGSIGAYLLARALLA